MSFCSTVMDYFEEMEDNELMSIAYNVSNFLSTVNLEKDDYLEQIDDNTLLVFKNTDPVKKIFINFNFVRKVTIAEKHDCANIFKKEED